MRSIRASTIVTMDADRARSIAADYDASTAQPRAAAVWVCRQRTKTCYRRAACDIQLGAVRRQCQKRRSEPKRDRAAAIGIGKTNTPELGAGSQTFNRVFGATRNPYDPSRTCGGSSGGAAVTLAARMLPLADGSDLGGSLRNPASFCNVLGLRPTPGRVPSYPTLNPWADMSVLGPMARSVDDIALFLSVLVGDDPRACRWH
jgi:hypothetical protein